MSEDPLSEDADLSRRRRESTVPLVILAILVLVGFGGLLLYILLGSR